MKIFIKILIFTVLVFAIIMIFVFSILNKTKVIIGEVKIPTVNETIYLKNIRAGLNTDNLIISNTKWNYSLGKREIHYNWEETLFYKVSNDTLYILCGLPVKEACIVNKKVKIIQIQYSNQYYYTLKDKYKELGLKMFPPDRN